MSTSKNLQTLKLGTNIQKSKGHFGPLNLFFFLNTKQISQFLEKQQPSLTQLKLTLQNYSDSNFQSKASVFLDASLSSITTLLSH